MPSSEDRQNAAIRERLAKLETTLRFHYIVGSLFAVLILSFLGIINFYSIPEEAKLKVPTAVTDYLDRERPELISEIEEAASRVDAFETLALGATERIIEHESSVSSKDNMIWTAIHAASAAACAAFGDPISESAHITIPRKGGVSCEQSCAATKFPKCRGMIAIGQVETARASHHYQQLSAYYRYSCASAVNSYDEVRKDDLDGASFTANCCCYK